MQRNAILAAVIVAAGASGSYLTRDVAFAADLSMPAGPADCCSQDIVYQPRSTIHRQFYVRGDIGIARHDFGGFSQADLAANGGEFVSQSVGDVSYLGIGFGWQVDRRFRFDVTGEYRASAQVKAVDNLYGDLLDATGTSYGTLQANTHYQGQMTGVVGLLNGYWDIGHWRGFTPYIGAGLGVAHLRAADFTGTAQATFTDSATGDTTLQHSTLVSKPHSQTNFAWALMAGTSFDLSPNAKLDVGYRYLNMGSGATISTSLLDCTCGTVGRPLKVSDLDAHELRIGIRWLLGNEPAPSVPAHQPLK